MIKKCSKCKLDKDTDFDFHKNKSKPNGFAFECKVCKNQQDKIYRDTHKEYYKNYIHNYRKENKASLDTQKKEYIEKNKSAHIKRQNDWYERNKADVKARTSQYKKDHPKQYQMYNNKRVALKKTQVSDSFQYNDIIAKYGNLCVYCGGEFEHIDHYIPLSKGGSHTLDNIRPACEKCNLRKSNKDPEEFLSSVQGKLNE